MLFTLIALGCADVEKPHDDHDHDHEHEVMTTVELLFTDSEGAESISLWADPENDGDPQIDDVLLSEGAYTLALRFLNEMEAEPEDVTIEINDEAEEHQVFFTGSAPLANDENGILDISYGDVDENGLPVGLLNDLTASAGTAELTVTLRHMPPESGTPVKVEGLEDEVYANGFDNIPGANDISVTFPVTVEAASE